MAFNLASMTEAVETLDDSKAPKTRLKVPNRISLVFFDTETTGLKATSEIIQMAARCGDKIYNEYIIPKYGIPEFITGLTGFSLVDKKMYNREGEQLRAVSKQTAVSNFLKYLSSIDGRIILVAHNCFKFDAPMLLTLFREMGVIEEVKTTVLGFSDTLPLFRESLPDRRYQGKDYKLVSLAAELLGECSGAHDAMNDVMMMEALVRHPAINVEASSFIDSRISVGQMLEKLRGRLRRVDIQSDYQALKAAGKTAISDDLIERLANAGIAMDDLTEAMKSGGCQAVTKILDQKLKRSGA